MSTVRVTEAGPQRVTLRTVGLPQEKATLTSLATLSVQDQLTDLESRIGGTPNFRKENRLRTQIEASTAAWINHQIDILLEIMTTAALGAENIPTEVQQLTAGAVAVTGTSPARMTEGTGPETVNSVVVLTLGTRAIEVLTAVTEDTTEIEISTEVGIMTEEIGIMMIEAGIITEEIGIMMIEAGIMIEEIGIMIEAGILTKEIGIMLIVEGIMTEKIRIMMIEAEILTEETGIMTIEARIMTEETETLIHGEENEKLAHGKDRYTPENLTGIVKEARTWTEVLCLEVAPWVLMSLETPDFEDPRTTMKMWPHPEPLSHLEELGSQNLVGVVDQILPLRSEWAQPLRRVPGHLWTLTELHRLTGTG